MHKCALVAQARLHLGRGGVTGPRRRQRSVVLEAVPVGVRRVRCGPLDGPPRALGLPEVDVAHGDEIRRLLDACCGHVNTTRHSARSVDGSGVTVEEGPARDDVGIRELGSLPGTWRRMRDLHGNDTAQLPVRQGRRSRSSGGGSRGSGGRGASRRSLSAQLPQWRCETAPPWNGGHHRPFFHAKS